MKTIDFFAALVAIIAVGSSLTSCNPSCESLSNVQVNSNINAPGYQFVITASPLIALEGKKVTIGNEEAESEYHPNIGLLVRVPTNMAVGLKTMKIEDPDCLEVINLDMSVVSPQQFYNNINFVSPIPPNIIIPTIPTVFPINVNNAWLSPENPEYCLWFIMDRNTSGIQTKFINPDSSMEQGTCPCGKGPAGADVFYATSPISGVIDKVGNNIHIFIDRSQQPNGFIEEYKGVFVDIKQTEDYYENRGALVCPCNNTNVPNVPLQGDGYMMLLTSQKTGKQTVAYQLKL